MQKKKKNLFSELHNTFTICIDCTIQQRVGLKGREKEQMWKELLKILRPGQLMGPKFIIPEVDDFDPDTYGKPVEQTIKGT